MIMALTCSCGGAEPLVRKVFRATHNPNWLNIPIYKGDKAKAKIIELANTYQDTQFQVLRNYISSKSTYAVILGFDEQNVRWVDVSMGDNNSLIKGQIIVEDFA